jgi:hypothetical protein
LKVLNCDNARIFLLENSKDLWWANQKKIQANQKKIDLLWANQKIDLLWANQKKKLRSFVGKSKEKIKVFCGQIKRKN